MRALVQRVTRASVSVEGQQVAAIGAGLLVLLGVTHDDDEAVADRLAEKVRALRIFDDADGRMNDPLGDREVLCVSQFTLYGDARKGNRPSYVAAARPEQAEPLYERFADRMGAKRGRFGARMAVELVNDGPVTLLLGDRESGRAGGRRRRPAGRPRLGHNARLVPPEDRFVSRFAAEPPQELLPYGRWAERLREEFLAACLRVDTEGVELGDPGEVAFYPDRTWTGRTYVPATVDTGGGYQLFGYVSFIPGDEDEGDPTDFEALADFTDETAARNPDWKLDLCDEVVGVWRGEEGRRAAMTLVWGRPMGSTRGAIVTAELGGLAVDQCVLMEDRFTLIAPDDYRGDTLEITLWNRRGESVATESLYEEDDEGEA